MSNTIFVPNFILEVKLFLLASSIRYELSALLRFLVHFDYSVGLYAYLESWCL